MQFLTHFTRSIIMSNKPSKASLKVTQPRKFKVIQDEAAQLNAQAGQLQYQVFVYQKELDLTNDLLMKLNHEAAARQKLDKEEADLKAVTETTEVKNESK